MNFYDWSQEGGADQKSSQLLWYIDMESLSHDKWNFMSGHYIENWDPSQAVFYDNKAVHNDFPFTSNDIHVYSTKLRKLMEDMKVKEIQYLPIRIEHKDSHKEVGGYQIANYLNVVDCLDRQRAEYQVWTKENLLYWDERPHLLGTFRDISSAVLVAEKIADARMFRLWGFRSMVIVREDVKRTIEDEKITGCRFTSLEVV